jgi:hypothetical protein
MTGHRFPPAWSIEELEACFGVLDAFYFGRRRPS